MDLPSRIQARITEIYLVSSDFNGIQISLLIQELGVDRDTMKGALIELIHQGKIAAVFDINPHVRRFPDRATEEQARLILEDTTDNYCLYPTRNILEKVVDRSQYADRPFTLELALGAAQLEPKYFDLSVLEFYRNDPRYHYETNDVSGWISISDEYYRSDKMDERDKISLQHFGFGHDKDFGRVVVVYLRYLNTLSPEHQKVWHARILHGEYHPHPDYYRSNILGEWPERVSMFEAFIEELRAINEMTTRMGRSPLFRSDFKDRPRGFGFLVRPTSKELNEFVHLLDKMISENINREFFKGDISLEEDIERADGKIVVKQIGTIRLLECWFNEKFRTHDPKPLERAFVVFKKIRKLRQHPAHVVNDDRFDQQIFKEQRELVIEVYGALRTIRQCFANHPAAKEVEVQEEVYKGLIWTF